MEKQVGVVAVIIKDRMSASRKVNEVLSQYGEMIIGRMGIPYHQRNTHIISIIVDGTTDEIGAMTGKLGSIPEVLVKSTLVNKTKGCCSQ
ncbi:MAG: iron-only hydrogenase system regulator [Candidatus Aureabacteria bacterium]|nr:iron-only hydrogenase system regulator [Candidatus Auribacterota bacterium]